MRIYVGGSLEHGIRDPSECNLFVEKLGVEIVKQGHILLNGCRSSFDAAIAKAAQDWLDSNKRSTNTKEVSRDQIISYYLKDEKPIHNYGMVHASALRNWRMDQPDTEVPEQIGIADAAIFVAGSDGTFWARNWAHYARKPIFGIPRFNGSGEKIYDQELENLRRNAPGHVEEYETLNQLSSDMEHYANEVITVVEHRVKPRDVFLIMSFKPEYDDAYRMYKKVCKQFGFNADRTKDLPSLERITELIEHGIQQSAFVIADVSEESCNIFYEIGFAKALGKDVLLTARKEKETRLPFDIYDLQTIFWEKPDDLKCKLKPFMDEMAKRHGK